MKRTRIKICGLTREADVACCVDAGADALGFVFYPPSPRALSVERAAGLMRRVPPFVSRVGLFVNDEPARVEQIAADLALDLLQFHGDEPAEYCARFNRPWIKAARMKAGFDLLEFCNRYAAARGCVGVLADAYVSDFGGAGTVFDWSLIPARLPLPLVLSGGLDAANIGRAIHAVRPWAVDVSSGVEPAGGPKGVKAAERISEFIAGVRNADAVEEL